MAANNMLSAQMTAGWLLILSWFIFLAGGFLYTGRAIWKWPVGQTRRYLILERGFVIAALLLVSLGLNLLERLIEAAGDSILAPSGWVLWLIAAVVAVLAETFFISRQEWLYAPIAAFVILAFLAQAFFGAALLSTGLLPGWVGWTAVLWNLGWLVILPIARPKDMYYPWLHYIAPLLIGIGLLISG